MWEILVYVGVGFSCVSIFPQLWQTYQTKKVRDLNPGFLVTQVLSEGLFITYASINHEWMMLSSAVLPGVGTATLLALYWRYRNTESTVVV